MAPRFTEKGIVFDIDGDPNPLAGTINKAVADAKGAGKRLDEALFGPAFTGAKKLQDAMGKAGTAGRKAGEATKSGMKGAAAATIEVVNALKRLELGQQALASAIVHDRELFVRASKEKENEATRLANEQLRLAKNTNAQQVVQIQQQTAAANAAARSRLQTARFMFESLGRLEKGFGAAISGTARTVTSVFSRAFSGVGRVAHTTASGITSAFRRSDSDITRHFQSSLTTRESSMRGSMSRQERILSSSITRQSVQIQRLNTIASRGVVGAATGRGAGVGLGGIAAGGGVAALLTSGFQRFSDLERLNKQFLALTDSAGEAATLMAQVKQFAKITPFDLVGVADLAKGFLTIGTKAEDVLPQVQAIADAVAFTGGGVPELDRIRRALGQVVSTGKLQGDELNQLGESLVGINITKLLAEQITGGDTAALLEMKEAGEITSDIFMKALITGLQQDKRLVGASEDIAKTLSGRFANLKESFADFGASLIGLVAVPLKQAITGIQTVLQTLSDFLKGEGLSAPLRVLRSALFGAAAGMAAVVAAKGAIEVFRLLTTTVGLLLTPFGAVLAIAGLFGAAITLLARDLPEVGAFFDGLKTSIAELAAGPLNSVRGLISNVLEFFTDAPTQAAAAEGGGNMVRAFNGGIEQQIHTASPFSVWVRDTLIPAVKDAIGFVRTDVIPVFVRVGEVAVEGFRVAEEAVLGFFRRVQPTVQPAIDGFQALAKALGPSGLIAAAAGIGGLAVGGPLVGAALAGIALIGTRLAGLFGGDLGAVGTGGRAAAAGIGQTLGNIGSLIKKQLAPVAKEIGDFLNGIFTGPNLEKFAEGFLNVVEKIGFILGNLMTNPKVIAAVGLIAAGAVVVGLRFAEGFAKGVYDNIPALLSGAVKLIGKALFDPDILIPIVLGVFAFKLLLQPLLATFRNLGSGAGKAFGGGLGGAVRGGRGFLSTLFGGVGGAGQVAKQIEREMVPLRRQFRLLGGDATKTFEPTNKGLRELQGGVAKLAKGFTPAELAGLRMADKLQAAFTSAGLIKSGIGGMITGARQIGAAFRDAGKTIGSGFVAAGRNFVNNFTKNFAGGTALGTAAASMGTQTGQKFGTGLVAGIGGGLKTFSTSVRTTWTGLRTQAAEQGTSVGRAFGSAALVGIGGFLGGKAEGAAGGSGILSALTAGLTGLAVGGPIVGIVGAGAALIGAHFGSMNKAAEDARQRIATFSTAISGDMKQAIEDGLLDLDRFRAGMLEFRDIADLGAVEEAFAGLTPETKAFLNTIDVGFNSRILPTLKRTNGDVNTLKDSIVAAARARGLFTEPFDDSVSVLTTEQQYDAFFKFIEGGFGNVTAAQEVFLNSDVAKPLRDALADLGVILPAVVTGFDQAKESSKFFADLPGSHGQQFGFGRALSDMRLRALGVRDVLDDVNQGLKDVPSDAYAEVISSTQRYEEAMRTAEETQFRLLHPETPSTEFIDGLNASLISLEGSFEGLDPLGGTVAKAKFDTASKELSDQLKDDIAAAVKAGTVLNVEDATAQVGNPYLDSILKGVTNEQIRTDLTAQVQGIVATFTPQLIAQQAGGATLADLLSSQAFALPEIDFTLSDFDLTANDQARLKGQAEEEGRPIGGAMGAGVAQGLRNAQADINRVAAQIIETAGAAMRGAARIRSPSLVFAEIGEQIGAGLAKGIADSETDITSAVTSALEGAIEAARSTGSRLGDALRDSTTQLFGKLTGTDALVPGPGNSFDLTSAMAGLTNASQSVLSNFDSNASQLFDVSKRANDLKKDPRGDPLSNADKAILGADLFSLDVSTIFGASNVSSFAGALDSIAGLGETLLAQGRPAQEVASTLEGYVDRLVDTGVSLGFNRDQLLSLVDTLGLSDAALAEFVKQVNALGSAASQPLPPGPQEQTNLNRPVINQTIYLPTTDGQAGALSVANALALGAYIPGA